MLMSSLWELYSKDYNHNILKAIKCFTNMKWFYLHTCLWKLFQKECSFVVSKLISKVFQETIWSMSYDWQVVSKLPEMLGCFSFLPAVDTPKVVIFTLSITNWDPFLFISCYYSLLAYILVFLYICKSNKPILCKSLRIPAE